MENTFDPGRATAMGLDCSDAAIQAGRWMPMLPEHSEHVSDMARAMVASDVMSLVVVDSIGAMESAKTLAKDADSGAVAVGRNAKIITQMCKALSTDARLHKCTVILINQPRANIGGMGGDISAGPKLLEHSTTVKISMRAKMGEDDVRKLKVPGDDDPVVVSHKVVAKVGRMKNGLPGRSAEFFMNRVATPQYGPPGVDLVDEYVTIGLKAGAIVRKGAWYVLPDGTQKQGRIPFASFLRGEPKYLEAIREAIVFDTPTDEYGDPLGGDDGETEVAATEAEAVSA
jgi:recombination protein RecA